MRTRTLVLLCSLLPLVNAFCYMKPPMKKDATHCWDDADHSWHAVGSRWRNRDCLDCTCEQCCQAYDRPTRYPADCVAVFDPAACEVIVHKKDEPHVRCPVFSSVGK